MCCLFTSGIGHQGGWNGMSALLKLARAGHAQSEVHMVYKAQQVPPAAVSSWLTYLVLQ
jgi:hypothetical protein